MSKTPVDEMLRQAKEAAQARELETAAALLEQVLSEAPDTLQALDLFGFVRFFQQRFAEAEEYCRRALELSPDHAYAHKGLGLCLARQGHVDQGQASLQRAISLKPGWFDPYWDLAVVLRDAGRLQEALAVLARAQVAVPRHRARLLSFSRQLRARQAVEAVQAVQAVQAAVDRASE